MGNDINNPSTKQESHHRPLDVARIRQDFPILTRQIYGKPLVYLDNAATSQKPTTVIQALVDYYERYNSNVHRGVHHLSMEATQKYEEAREKVAQFIGAPSSENLIWVRSTTEAINLVASTWATSHIKTGDEILLTEMEHHSNLVPWQKVAMETGALLRFIPVTDEGLLDLTDIDNLLTERTRLLAVTHMSNVLGTINPIQDLTRAAHSVGAVVLVDGAQSVPHIPVNVKELDCDFLAFSSHKMLGPTGIGTLFVRDTIMQEMDPYQRGGEMVKDVWLDGASWNDKSLKFEAGTPNIADAIAMGAAVDYLQTLGMANVREHEIQITRYALNAFQELNEELDLYGTTNLDVRGSILSFYSSDVHPHDLGTLLDRDGIAIRTGHHCAIPLMKGRLGVPATARASFYIYNTEEEVNMLVTSLKKALRYFSQRTARNQ